MDGMNFISGIVAGVVANLIWVGLKEFASLGPMFSKHPDIRGKWVGVYTENGKEYRE